MGATRALTKEQARQALNKTGVPGQIHGHDTKLGEHTVDHGNHYNAIADHSTRITNSQVSANNAQNTANTARVEAGDAANAAVAANNNANARMFRAARQLVTANHIYEPGPVVRASNGALFELGASPGGTPIATATT